jgi:hypothetical protein
VALQRVEELRLAATSPFVDERSAEILRVALRSVEAVHFRLATGATPGTGTATGGTGGDPP